MIFDAHVHVGQFENSYYNPYIIVNLLKQNGVYGAYISSTTSCIKWDNIHEKKLVVEHIQAELREALFTAQNIGFEAKPLCWLIPQRFVEGETLEDVYSEGQHYGFKIHPRAHDWDINKSAIQKLMNRVCACAADLNVPVWIHTGTSNFESPRLFEHWYCEFPSVKFVIAHCKDIESSIRMMEKYPNVYGDVAFLPPAFLDYFGERGCLKKMVFGSDFPITAFSDTEDNIINTVQLNRNYRKILSDWKSHLQLLGDVNKILVY